MTCSNFSFRNKILICFLLIIFLLSGFSLILSYFITDISLIGNTLVDHSVPELLILSYWQNEIHVKRMVLERFVERQSFMLLEEFYDYNLDGMTEIGPIPDSLDSIKREIDRVDFTYKNKIKGLLKYNNFKTAEIIIVEELFPDLIVVEKMIEEAYLNTYHSLTVQSNAISIIIVRALWSLFFISSIATLLSIYFSYKISLSLTKPVNELIRKVVQISQGRYGLQVQPLAQYELQRLTYSINYMSSSLQESFATLSKEKLFREQILASIPIGIITVNDEKEEIEVNEKALALIGLNVEALNAALYNPFSRKNNEEFWSWFHSKEFFQTRKTGLYSHQQIYQIIVSQTPLLDQNESIIGRIFYFMDISEMDRLEKRIYHSEKLALVGELAAGSAHEIRNPLAVIHGFVQLMQYNLNQKEQDKYHIPLLLQELERINRIVEDMLLLAKPGAPQVKCAHFQGILDEILPLIYPSLPPNVSLKVEMDPFVVRVDPGQMKQVFHNLIRNSMEAIGEEGEIRIYSQIEKDQVHIFVEDNGPGIQEEIRDNLFEPFVSTKETGTGLGLTIIQRIMESHHGEIELVKSSDKGTTFRITLPLTSE